MADVVAVVAVVIVRQATFLALRRSPHREAGPGIWETVSGRLEPGEQPLDAARREVLEETGLSVELDPRPIDCYLAQRLDRPMLVVVYRARWLSGELARSHEHDADAWWTPGQAREAGMPPRLVDAVERAWSATIAST